MTEPLKIASAATLAGALASALALAGSASAFRLDADRLASMLSTLRPWSPTSASGTLLPLRRRDCGRQPPDRWALECNAQHLNKRTHWSTERRIHSD
jgi:hypothetical protein